MWLGTEREVQRIAKSDRMKTETERRNSKAKKIRSKEMKIKNILRVGHAGAHL